MEPPPARADRLSLVRESGDRGMSTMTFRTTTWFAVAAAMAGGGRFSHPAEETPSPLSNIEPASDVWGAAPTVPPVILYPVDRPLDCPHCRSTDREFPRRQDHRPPLRQ